VKSIKYNSSQGYFTHGRSKIASVYFFVSVISRIKDFRRPKGKQYQIDFLLFCLLLTELKNCHRQRQRHRWLRGNWSWITEVWFSVTKCSVPKSVPSQSTLSRLMEHVDFYYLKEQFFRKLIEHNKNNSSGTKQKHYAIDGKSRKGIVSSETGRTEIDLTIWDVDSKQVISSQTLHDKQGESTSATYLLKKLGKELEPGIFTGDAGFTSPNFISSIISAGHDYIIGFKSNAGLAYDACVNLPWNKAPILDESFNKGHGREEIRIIKRLYINPKIEKIFEKYKNVLYFYQITSKVKRYGKWTEEIRYYIGSSGLKGLSMEEIQKIIRSHWGQENNLHWVKDTILNEDNLPKMGNRSSRLLGFLKNIVVSIGNIVFSSVQEFIDVFDAEPERMTRELFGLK